LTISVRPRAAAAVVVLGIIMLGLGDPRPLRAQPAALEQPRDHAVCRLIEDAAAANRLPVGFMTRIIWRESSFRPTAVSPAGAEGIAQFMPATASERSLIDPFDPQQAIPKAAHLLAALRAQFGNLGLAAAAYNAGAARVAGWLAGQGALPAETRLYVRLVTARDAETWTGAGSTATPETGAAASPSPSDRSCLAVTAELRQEDGGGDGSNAAAVAPPAPWGVQLAGNFSKALALAEFDRAERRYAAFIGDPRPMIIGRRLRHLGTRTFFQVRLPAPSRIAADLLCGRIRAFGGACVALPS
jgi:hypothetical protein